MPTTARTRVELSGSAVGDTVLGGTDGSDAEGVGDAPGMAGDVAFEARGMGDGRGPPPSAFGMGWDRLAGTVVPSGLPSIPPRDA
ncbi:MAG TPA: hypothetical protein VIY86_08010, partial [Pirellulaceae bacterium]